MCRQIDILPLRYSDILFIQCYSDILFDTKWNLDIGVFCVVGEINFYLGSIIYHLG